MRSSHSDFMLRMNRSMNGEKLGAKGNIFDAAGVECFYESFCIERISVMNQKFLIFEETADRVGKISGHLLHPTAIGLLDYTHNLHFPRFISMTTMCPCQPFHRPGQEIDPIICTNLRYLRPASVKLLLCHGKASGRHCSTASVL